MKWPFRKKADPDPQIDAGLENYLQQPSLEEQLAAIDVPAELYRIGEDFTNGLWWVEGWSKRIGYEPSAGYNSLAQYMPRVISGYTRLAHMLPSRERAELWLSAHVAPEKHRTGYDAEGNRLEVTP